MNSCNMISTPPENFKGGTYHRLISLFVCLLLCVVGVSAASAAHSCLTLSADGTTVTGSNGCTVLTAADWGTATRIADGTSNSYVFKDSKNTLTSIEFPSNFGYPQLVVGFDSFVQGSFRKFWLDFPHMNTRVFSAKSGWIHS